MHFEEVIILIPSHGLEDFPYELDDDKATGLLNAFAVVWHPQLLAHAQRLPRWEPADQPMKARAGQLILVPEACDGYLSESWPAKARADGACVITGIHHREALLAAALQECDPHSGIDPELVADFLAFGSCHLHQELLTREMRNYSQLDTDTLLRHAQSAAQAALQGDTSSAKTSLGSCFEMLLEARERYYPVECWLIDLCLVAPDQAGEPLRQLVQAGLPVSLLAPHHGWSEILAQDASIRDLLRDAARSGTVEVIGGQRESLDGLMSLDANLHSLQAGRKLLQSELDLLPTTWGRKRFGHSSQLPQLLSRSGYQGALHFVLDDGVYPEDEASLLRWQGAGNSEISAFSRLPMAVDSASSFIRFARRMAEAMDYDHAAAVVLLRWPRTTSPFLDDLIRGHRYQPVFGKFTTFSNFFSRASVPGRKQTHAATKYRSPALTQAMRSKAVDPISRHVRWWERERSWQRTDWLRNVTAFLKASAPAPSDLETIVRAAHPECAAAEARAADEALQVALGEATGGLRDLLTSRATAGAGVLIVNTLSFPRKVLVEWPTGTVPPQHPLVIHRQIDAQRAWGLVDLPPCGFTWLPALPRTSELTKPGKIPLADQLVLRTDLFEVRLSPVTGGIGQISTYRRSPNRLSQQTAVRFARERVLKVDQGDGHETTYTHYSAMRLRESRVLSAGPLRGEVETVGDLRDEQSGKLLGVYKQITRTTRGKPVVEVELEIGLQEPLGETPWEDYLGCRFAWAHEDVAMSASMQEGAHPVTSERMESPHFVELVDEQHRTTILSPGQPFFRKSGERMLDMLLCATGETSHHFRFAVAIDEAYPLQASLDAFSPPVVIATSQQPAEGARQGWFAQVSAANVQLQRLQAGPTGDSIKLRLLETEGRARKVTVQLCRSILSAQRVNFLGEQLEDLTVADGIQLEMAAHELCDVEVRLQPAGK